MKASDPQACMRSCMHRIVRACVACMYASMGSWHHHAHEPVFWVAGSYVKVQLPGVGSAREIELAHRHGQ